MNRHISAAFAAALLAVLVKQRSLKRRPLRPPAAPPEPAVPAPVTPPAPVAAEGNAPAASAPNAALEKEITLQRADLDEQDARIAELETQLKALKTPEAPKKDQKKAAAAAAPAAVDFPLKVTGYVQAQYEFHQDSEDQLQQGARCSIRTAFCCVARASSCSVNGSTAV